MSRCGRAPQVRRLGGRAVPTKMSSVVVGRLGVLLFLFTGLGLPSEAVRAASLNLDGFELTFEERFDTLDIAASGPGTRWIAHTPWHGDFGDAAFGDPGPEGPFSMLPGGGLRITARKDASGLWHSGLICSMDRDGAGQQGFAQRFGYFEMRAKLPDGPGVWPAFWLIGVDKRRSASEIDVFEYYGTFPGYFHSWMHVFQNGMDILLQDHITHVDPDLMTSRQNDYGVLIEPDLTRFYLNRQEIWAMKTPPEYHQKMYILADLALGSGWPITKLASPVSMDITHILVFRDLRRPEAAVPAR